MNTELNQGNPFDPAPLGAATKGLKEIAGDTRHLLKDAGCAVLQEISATGSAMSNKARNMTDSAYQLAKEKPWAVLGVAAATGLIIGAMIRRH